MPVFLAYIRMIQLKCADWSYFNKWGSFLIYLKPLASAKSFHAFFDVISGLLQW